MDARDVARSATEVAKHVPDTAIAITGWICGLVLDVTEDSSDEQDDDCEDDDDE